MNSPATGGEAATPPDLANRTGPPPPADVASRASRSVLASCRGVGVTLGRGDTRVVALADVTLAVRERDALVLWGRSGSGKSTLLHVLGGLLEPTRGTVELLACRSPPCRNRRRSPAPGRDRLRLPEPEPAAPPHRLRERRLRGPRRASAETGDRTPFSPPAPARAWWVSPRRRTACPPSCRAAKHSVLRSRGRLHRRPSSCSATSRPATSTPTQASACSTSSRRCSASSASPSCWPPTTPDVAARFAARAGASRRARSSARRFTRT